MKNIRLILTLIITSPFVDAQDLGNPNCDSLLLVSSWFNDNVKIFDGCDGQYIRDLAENGVLDGPQSIFQDPNGDVIVVSESNHKLIKFDQATLSTATTVVASDLMDNPITVVKKDDNHVYLGSYSGNNIIELNTQTWQAVRTVLPVNNGQIQGIDIGMAMGPDGQLYVPGYDSDNVLKVNPMNGSTSQFISSGANGLNQPRSILFLNDRILVTAWGNLAVYSYSLNGQFQGEVISGLPGPAGMMQDGPDHILLTSDTLNTVRRYQLSDFSFETLVANRSGGLAGATFVYRLQKQTNVAEVTGMRQAFLTGLGTIDGNQLTVSSFATTGGAFGLDFNPDDVNNVFWGTMTFEFSSCHTAQMTYDSVLAINGVAFGSGGYQVGRLAMNASGQACESQGYELMNEASFMGGTFYGGELFDGEGFTIDYLNEGQAIVTWYTYLPTEGTCLPTEGC
ncbi:hypothetical protein [Marinicella litoralis]|uniref:NHL repeat-containing protein n=1 Tax=Marinicella litoralis TaxID=644220 RepID=A0A4R6XY46_9GAMM|nr:hypothetical protein [Marinicella litoralis]TDR22643.1 hypothetical protein C8D91_1135 [Marinicella litoralis]